MEDKGIVLDNNQALSFLLITCSMTLISSFTDFKSLSNMSSSQLTTLVPVFTGSNWTIWSSKMTDYLQAMGVWAFVSGDEPAPPKYEETSDAPVASTSSGKQPAAAPTTSPRILTKEYREWRKSDHQALGCIKLRIADLIKHHIKDAEMSFLAWFTLEEKFGKAGSSLIFGEFRQTLNFCLSGGAPVPEIN